MNCSAIAFIITVVRISLTPRRALRIPGTKPQNAPATNPTTIVDGIRSAPGQVRNVSANQVAKTAPRMIWPSAPILITLARKAMQMPSPTSSSGVALTRVWVIPDVLPNAPSNSAR